MALCNYQVFLSFRGPDTRDNLVQYLHDRLQGLRIVSFLDSEEIDYGHSIRDVIVDAIESSDICVPVFSPDFATSTPCLKEVAQMVKSKKQILPIFFFVEPSVVKYQKGTYETSFDEHERKGRYTKSTILEWRNALEKIADKTGPVFKNAALEVALEAALENINGIKGSDFKKAALEAALEKIDSMKGCELTKADLETALEAALKKVSVIKGPDFTKAVEAALEKIGGIAKAALGAALAKTGGQFYTALFKGFRKLEDFISDIWKLFKMYEEGVPRNLVGTDRDVPEMMRKLGFYYQNGVVKERAMTVRRVLVVWGMPRVGKTTLAKVVFHEIKHLFQGCSFLEDVQGEFAKNSEVSLLNKLIRELKGGGIYQEVKSSIDGTRMIQHMFRNKRVLILLDDVDDVDQFKQIKTLAAGELSWFGEGSAIILTTTKRSVFDFYKNPHPEENQGNFINDHEVLPMDEDHALELFYMHAFPLDHPRDAYENRSREIIRAVEYLPYAIEMVGRYLNGKSDADWMETANGLKRSPEEEVGRILKKRYDSVRE